MKKVIAVIVLVILSGCATKPNEDVESLSTFQLCYEQAYTSKSLVDDANREVRSAELHKRRTNGSYVIPQDCNIGTMLGKKELHKLDIVASVTATIEK